MGGATALHAAAANGHQELCRASGALGFSVLLFFLGGVGAGQCDFLFLFKYIV